MSTTTKTEGMATTTQTTTTNTNGSNKVVTSPSTPTSSSSESSPGSASLAFNERNFAAKLDAIAPTQDSIQSLGLWILHHKFNHDAICRIWLDKMTDSSGSSKQKLALFYLANEVIQNCRRKNAKIFQETFKRILPRAIEIVGRNGSIVKNVERVLDVWLERDVYDREFITKLTARLQDEKSKILNSPDEATNEALNKTVVSNSTNNKSPPKTATNHHHHHHHLHNKVAENPVLSSQSSSSLSPHKNTFDASSIEEIIAEFQVKKLCESLTSFQEMTKEANLKKSQVDATRIVDISSEHVKQYRDKSQCAKFKAEFENSCVKLEELLVKLEAQAKQRVELVRLMEKSEIFYEAQFNDAKTVNNVYRIYGSKVNTMKKKLDEYVHEKFDNKEISDMEMSDDESTTNATTVNKTTTTTPTTQKPNTNTNTNTTTRPSQNGAAGSIKTHLDPRQSRKTSSSTSSSSSSSNTNDSKSKQSSSTSQFKSTTSSSSSSSTNKRKNESEDGGDLTKTTRSSDPFDFLSKLINKSASMQQPATISGLSSTSTTPGETTNPNLSFLVSSLQKFVNSGSSSSSSTGTSSLQQPTLEYNPANAGVMSSGGSFYDDPYQVGGGGGGGGVGGGGGYMLMNAGAPPPATGFYPSQQPQQQPSPPTALSIAPPGAYHHHPQFYHPHPHHHHQLASPGAHPSQPPPHQLMEIDTHSYAAATAQLAYATSTSDPNSPNNVPPPPPPPQTTIANQISPLMALKADEFASIASSIDPSDFQQPPPRHLHPSHPHSHHPPHPHFNKPTQEQFDVYDYEYDPTTSNYPTNTFQRFDNSNKKRFFGGQNRRNSYNNNNNNNNTNFDFDPNTGGGGGYHPYNRFQRGNSYQDSSSPRTPNNTNRPNPKSPGFGAGQHKNLASDFGQQQHFPNRFSNNNNNNNNNRYA